MRRSLTPRETNVLLLIAQGLSSADVARTMYVTMKDVDYHVGHLIQKFQVKNRTGVVARAYADGYLEPGVWPPRLSDRSPPGASG